MIHAMDKLLNVRESECSGWHIARCLGLDGGEPGASRTWRTRELADYFGFLPLEIYKLDRRISQPAAQGPRRRQDRRHRSSSTTPGRGSTCFSSGKKAGRGGRGAAVPQGSQRGRHRPADAAGERAGEQGGRQPRRRATSTATASPTWPSTARPPRWRSCFNEGAGRVRQSQADQHGRRRGERHRAWPWATWTRTAATTSRCSAENELIFVYQDRQGSARRARAAPAHRRATRGCSSCRRSRRRRRNDLVILDGGTDDPIHVRFASDGEEARPRAAVPGRAPRAIAFGQIDGKPGAEILTIERPVGPGQGAHARRGRRTTSRTSAAA